MPPEEEEFVSRLDLLLRGWLHDRAVLPENGEEDDPGVVSDRKIPHGPSRPQRIRGNEEDLDHLLPQKRFELRQQCLVPRGDPLPQDPVRPAADQLFLLRDDVVGDMVLAQNPGEDLDRRLEFFGDDRVRP